MNTHNILHNVQTKDKIDDVNLSQPKFVPRLPYLLITLILSFVSIVFQYFSGKSYIADEAQSVLDHKYKIHAKDITISYDVVGPTVITHKSYKIYYSCKRAMAIDGSKICL